MRKSFRQKRSSLKFRVKAPSKSRLRAKSKICGLSSIVGTTNLRLFAKKL
jgi:hypothetical protein